MCGSSGRTALLAADRVVGEEVRVVLKLLLELCGNSVSEKTKEFGTAIVLTISRPPTSSPPTQT